MNAAFLGLASALLIGSPVSDLQDIAPQPVITVKPLPVTTIDPSDHATPEAASQPKVNAQLVGYRTMNAWPNWVRYDIRFTNQGDQAVSLGACPQDSGTYRTIRTLRMNYYQVKGKAVDFANEGYTRNCTTRVIGPNQDLAVSFYFDNIDEYKGPAAIPPHSVLLKTTLGDWFIYKGRIETIEEARARAAR